MRKDFGKKTNLLVYPVLIIGTYDEFGNPNAMNAAWGGQTDTNKISIALASHKTTDNLLKTGAFTVSFATENTVEISDYFGISTGNKEDKVKKSGVHVAKSAYVNAPIFEEYPLTLECKVVSYENEVLVGDIINLSADESILDEKGNIVIEKMKPIIYEAGSHTYRKIGEVAGKAFKDGNKIKNA